MDRVEAGAGLPLRRGPCPRCSRSPFPMVRFAKWPRARPRPMSPRRSGRGWPRRRWRRGSMANCATSTGRSRATRASRWSPRATRRTRSSWSATTSRTSSPKRCRSCFRARRSPSARRPTTVSITTSRRAEGRGMFTDEDLPRDRGGDAPHHRRRRAAGPRGMEPRRRPRFLREARARRFKAEWVMELPEGEAITMYRSGKGDDGVDGPVPRAAPRLDRQARSAGVQADARVGRLLARRPGQSDAQPHLRHGVAQQEAARRASRPAGGSGQARPSPHRPGHGPVPPPGRGARQRVLAPQGLHPVAPAGGLYAPPARRRRL